ncbi:MAG: glycoside hydrolase family 2 TIM barrel-domain containing protein [Gemmataceae bacterium]
MCAVLAALPLLLLQPPNKAEGKPAKGPLMTRWAKDVDPSKPLPEYPRPQLVREAWLNLNGVWQFGGAPAGAKPPLGLDLPGKILVPFPVESALSGVMESHPHVWYRRTFEVPKAWAGQRVLLHFGAVNWEATVYVNGQKVTTHQGGYDPFAIDITEALKPGEPQELFVAVHNPIDAGTQPRGKQVRKPGGIFYTASTGIWQTVWLEPVPKASIESLKVVPNVVGSSATVEVKLRGPGKGLTVRCEARADDFLCLSEGDPYHPRLLLVPSPKLWSPESPFLYDLTVTLLDGKGAVVDRVTSYFGMRSSTLGKDKDGVTRLMLNGKPYFQVGLLDQGFWPDGLYTAPTDAALKYDIEITKKLGFNLARKHVKVEPARWYYWCDKLGLAVWQDMPSGDRSVAPNKGEIKRTEASAKQFELELGRMIDSLHHFPSIVLWVPFNEGWGQYDTKRIVDQVKKRDPSRLVNNASGWNDMACGDVHDFHVYPGPGSPKPEPTRAAVLGEFGGLGLATEGHMWTKEHWGYRGVRDQADLTRKYERLMQGVYRLKERPGLSACVYTQTTDVETEANGLLTYDRAVVKVDIGRVAAVNRGDLSRVPEVRPLVATSRDEGQPWRYTLAKPVTGWEKPDFDDAKWAKGPGGFGTKGTPGAVVRTEWRTKEIWLRREFNLESMPTGKLVVLMHHDEDAEVYVNGVLAVSTRGFISDYEEFPISPEAAKALKKGKNVLAVSCKQTGGGQYIDVGLAEVVELLTPR